MLPTHPFRFSVCSPSGGGEGGGVQPIFQPDPESSRGGGVGTGSGLSPSEIVKRKLHQRLMAGQAKKRRLSSSESASLLPELSPRVSQAAGGCGGDHASGGNESRSGDPKKALMITTSMEDSSGSSLSSAVGRLNNASNNEAILPPNKTTSDLCTAARASLPPSAGRPTMSFSAIFDTNKYASVSTVGLPFENQPMQHIATVEGFDASASVPTAAGSTNASEIGRLSVPGVNSLGEIFRYSEHQKVRKKKSRRPPKVKKIKFHEYKGPHRRTMAATQKLLSESSKKVKTENSVPTDSRPTPISSVGIEDNHRLNSNEVSPLNPEKPAIQNLRGPTDASISQELVLTSHKRRQVANAEGSQTDEPERSDRLVSFDKHSVDPGSCSSISKSSEPPKTSPAPQSDATAQPLNTAPRAVKPVVVQPIAQAGISAPLLVTAAAAVSRRKEKYPKTDIRATDAGERKVPRRTSAVLTAPPVTLDDLKVAELKEECKSRRLSVSGPKPRLVNRLTPFSDAILEQRRFPSAVEDASKSKCLPCLPPSTGKSGDYKGTRSTPEFQSVFHQKVSSNFNQKVHSVPKETNNGNDNNNDDDDEEEEDDNDDNNYDDGDEGSTSSLRPNAVGSGGGVCPTTVKCSRTEHPRRSGLGDDVIRSYTTVMTSYVNSIAATDEERRRPGGLTRPQPMTQPETDASRIQQQLLTPPTTPTLVPGYVGITCGNNGTGMDAGGVGGVGGGGSRWLYHVTSNGVPVTVTDSELWTMQERQIADLQQQLVKTKAQLMCARTKARLDDQCCPAAAAAVEDYRLPVSALIGVDGGGGGVDSRRRRGSVQQQQPPPARCLSEEARLALSSAIDNAERVFDGLKRDARAKHPVDISSSSSSSAHLRPLSGSIDFTGGGSPDLRSVTVPSNDGAPQPTETLGPPEESTPEHQDNLYESSSDVNETSDSLATDSESEHLPVRGSWYIPPTRKPPDYYEAMQQKLMQSRSMLMAKETEEAPRASVASLTVPSTDVSLRPTIVASKEEEEIEDVLEVLLRSGELNATEILPERLIWQQDPMTNFTKEGRHALTHPPWHIPQNTSSQQRLQSDNDSYEGSECTPDEGAPQPDSTVETIHYRACRVTGGPTVISNNNSLGRYPVVKEENPPSSIELAELFFDWNEVEYVNRSNVSRFFDSIPDESILCPREPITFPEYSLVNGCDWTGAGEAIPGLVRAEDWSAVTPCDSINSSGCNSTNDDDPVPVDQRFLLDGKLGVLSPGLTPPSAIAANEAGTERSFGDALARTDAYPRDAHGEGEWMEEFVDSKNFHAPTHLTVNNNPSSILSAFSFLQ